MAKDVFISYSSQDREVAQAICTWIEDHGIACWIAPRDILPSNTWGESIINAIKQAKLMLVVFSSHANASPQIKREVERAVHLGLPILPMRIEDVAPTGDLDYFLAIPQWFNAFAAPIESHLQSLVTIVEKLISAAPQDEERPPTPTTARPSSIALPSAPSGRRSGTSWPPELLSRVENHLALTVGPIAKILVKNAARDASDWPALTSALARQIETREEREAFESYCGSIRP
jgi:hypothetical protein